MIEWIAHSTYLCIVDLLSLCLGETLVTGRSCWSEQVSTRVVLIYRMNISYLDGVIYQEEVNGKKCKKLNN